ncbi:MAG: response regulator transcription factor [Deferribacteres bacterium]|nr:response regulator transcription factor [candidate division KSB1 bacterium]MCB9502215.1 response regulator transcription factor [Deferribacteres bacterium]
MIFRGEVTLTTAKLKHTIDIAIIEDDCDYRTGLQAFINSLKNMHCEHASGSVEDYLELLKEAALPDVILMDIGLPGMSGLEGIARLKSRFPELEIIMLTVYHDSEKIFDALRAGASGYLLKNTPLADISNAIIQAQSGGAPMSPQIARKVITFFTQPQNQVRSKLTERELEVVSGLVDGLSYKMIADRMDISIETVRFHIKNIYQKLHVHSKAEVIARSLRGEI